MNIQTSWKQSLGSLPGKDSTTLSFTQDLHDQKTDIFEGHDRIVQQVQITPKGLARLAELLSNEVAA